MGLFMIPWAWALDGVRAAIPFVGMAVVLGVGAAVTHALSDPGELAEANDDGIGAAAIGMGLAWLVFVTVCAVPFYSMAAWHPTAGAYGTVVDALFESISGLTTCGLSMASDANTLPHTLQLWRSVLQWVGGVGVVVLALTMLSQASDPESLMGAEVGSSFADSVGETARRIWGVYAVLSLVAFGGYLATGMHWWEAMNHAMSTVSTGGFAVTSHSFADYGAGPRAVACVVMIAAAISFAFYDRLVRGQWREALGSAQVHTLLVTLVAGAAITASFTEDTWGQILFQWCSAVTTCGLTTTGTLEEWTPIVLVVFGAAMAMGGCAGSTTGGFKTLRFYRALKALGLRIWSSGGADRSAPGEMLAEGALDDDVRARLVPMLKAGNFILLYLLSWVATMLGLAWTLEEEHAVGQLLFESASALSAVGLSAGLVSGDMPMGAKIVVEVAMWVGRLEVVGGLALFFGLFRTLIVAGARPDDVPAGRR